LVSVAIAPPEGTHVTISEVRDVLAVREIFYHDAAAPAATIVAPSVFAAVRDRDGRLLVVRRCDSGTWELPGGRVDVGEGAIDAVIREVAEESGVVIQVTGMVGLYTDPHYVVRSVAGEVRQPFVVVLRGAVTYGEPRPDGRETSAALWVAPDAVAGLPMQPSARAWIRDALVFGAPPHLS
jgi:8-oxo-dGTP pyrophosphatase MutT (NUDIX family)